MNLITYFILLQLQLEGFDKASEQSVLFSVLVSLILILFAGIIYLFKKYEDKNKELKTVQSDCSKKIEELQKENIRKFENLQKDILNREEERNKQWLESEKENLSVLNGVTNVLEMSEKLTQNDTKQILEKIQAIENRIIEAIKNISK